MSGPVRARPVMYGHVRACPGLSGRVRACPGVSGPEPPYFKARLWGRVSFDHDKLACAPFPLPPSFHPLLFESRLPALLPQLCQQRIQP